MQEEFYRIKRLPPYVFAEVNALKAKARAAGRDVIDLGMGNPDGPTPDHIVKKLVETVQNPRTHGYSVSRGIAGLRRAQAAYYARRFGVELDPEREVIVTLGSKEGLANLAQAITAPGDIVLVPNPCYPIHAFGFIMAGASVRHVPVGPGVDFMRELEKAVTHSVPTPVALAAQLPGQPDGAGGRSRFLSPRSSISAASAASSCCPTWPMPRSISTAIRRPRSCRCRARATSRSSSPRSARPIRWPAGASASRSATSGSSAALARVKSYLDYGAFTPIQVAATAALNGPQECIDEIRERYRARRDVLIDGLRQAGWEVPAPAATMFAWAPLPPAFRDLGSLAFSKLLLEHANVAVSPGVGFGEYGEGYVRIALVENRQRLRQATRNIKQFLGGRSVGGTRTAPARASREAAVPGE